MAVSATFTLVVEGEVKMTTRLNPRLTGGGGVFFAPTPVHPRYLPKLRMDHRQILNTLQTINFTRLDKKKTC